MWIPGHVTIGWGLARATGLPRRDRAIVAWSAAVPDLDGLAIVFGTATYVDVHHVWLHNLPTTALLAVAGFALARHRLMVAGLVTVTVLLHLVSDAFGLLQVRPLWPFARTMFWPNDGSLLIGMVGEVIVPAALLAWQVFVWRREGVSILEIASPRADRWLAERLADGAARGGRLAAWLVPSPQERP